MKKIISILLLICMLTLLFTACDDNRDNKNNHNNGGEETVLPDYGKEIGNRCFPTSLSLISGEGKVNINDYVGKIVVLNFWGTWCGPCVQELPHFNKVASDYSDDVVIIAVHSNSGIENAPEFINQNYPNSKIIFAEDEKNEKYYNLVSGSGYYPHTLILDENGVIHYSDYGVLSEAALKAEIEKLR